jgi:trehalose 6-phosphate phosphatase
LPVRRILAQANVELLQQFAWSKVLLAFDYDGTLAPIVDDPALARMRPATRALLRSVARLAPCVVISGRATRDIRKQVEGLPFADVIGNHGIASAVAPLVEEVRRWLPQLRQRLGGLKGVTIEDKGMSVALHYRRSREKRLARRRIDEAVELIPRARVIHGKQVVNVLPEGAPHKGLALRAARARLGCDTAIYVGDDEADEDVFSLDEPGQLLTIRVEESPLSRASFYLRDQREVDDLLRALIECRSTAGSRRRNAGTISAA